MAKINKKVIKLISIDKEKKSWRQKYYQNPQWKVLRKIKIQQNPLCEECLKNEIVTPAHDVHHIKSPFDGGLSEMERYRRLLDWNNLISLCRECHNAIHNENLKNKNEKDTIYK